MKFICLGYLDETVWDRMSETERQQTMQACMDYDDVLRRGGHFLGGEALDSVRNARTVKVVDGTVAVIDGPFSETKEVLGGILFLEARDIEHAVELMRQHPGCRVGPFEIRPACEEVNQLIAEREAALKGALQDA